MQEFEGGYDVLPLKKAAMVMGCFRICPAPPHGQGKNKLFLPLEQLTLVLAGSGFLGLMGTGCYSLARTSCSGISRRIVLLLVWSRHLLSSP
jgi:hypothetical protein